jgi:hypothetical protein
MRQIFCAAITSIGLGLFGTTAQAQSVIVNPGPGASVQYYSPYSPGYTTYYYNPSATYMYSTPYGGTYFYPGSAYTSNYVGPTVYGPGYTASYPYMYNQMNYGSYYPGYTTYRYYRYWR